MDKAEFQIYEPDGKFHLTPNWIVYGLYSILFAWGLSPLDKGILPTFAIITFLVSMYFLVASFFTYKPLNGLLKGALIFEGDKIIADGVTYLLSQINELDFFIRDYYGKRVTSGIRGNFDPLLYQGVNNYITFSDNLSQYHTIYFKLATEHHYEELSSFINEAIKMKKMSFKRGIDIVGIENVSINN